MSTNNITLVTHADYLSFAYKDWHEVLLQDYNAERVTNKCDCGKCDNLLDTYYFKIDSNDPELKNLEELVEVDEALRVYVDQVTFWHVVSISKADGHAINGKFMTSNEDTLRAFANAVNPLLITKTTLFTKDEGTELLDALHEAYVLIDPQDYLVTNGTVQ